MAVLTTENSLFRPDCDSRGLCCNGSQLNTVFRKKKTKITPCIPLWVAAQVWCLSSESLRQLTVDSRLIATVTMGWFVCFVFLVLLGSLLEGIKDF